MPADTPEYQGSDAAAGQGEPVVGHRRIHGELSGLGIRVAPPPVWETIKAAGVGPTPDRETGPTWAVSTRGRRGEVRPGR